VWQELFALAYRYLRGRGLSHADAEDIAQDTLLVTYQHLDGIEPGRLQAWVRAVARNKHIDLARSQARGLAMAQTLEETGHDYDPLTAALMADDQAEVRHLLSALSPTDRRLLELKYLEDRTVEQIAKMLGRSVNTVKVGLFRARNRVRTHAAREVVR
jgi:RNA polymerase sigma-70 factor (ECF subfamily)